MKLKNDRAWIERMAKLEEISGDCTVGVLPKPVVFLDCDGVLNNQETFRTSMLYEALEPSIVALFSDWILKVDANIVISSTWRLHLTLPQLKAVFRHYGKMPDAVLSRIIDYTPTVTHRFAEEAPRGDEILCWLREHPLVSNIVIFDDNSDMNRVLGSLVQTSFAIGLTAEHLRMAERVLCRPLPPGFAHHMQTQLEETRTYVE